jgi:hypothetical protein
VRFMLQEKFVSLLTELGDELRLGPTASLELGMGTLVAGSVARGGEIPPFVRNDN